MRITLVIGGLGGGGGERVCVNLANAWIERGHAVTLLTITQRSAPSAYAIDPRVERCDVGWPDRATPDVLDDAAIATIVRGLRAPGCEVLLEEIALLTMLRKAILATQPEVVVAHMDLTSIRVIAALHETALPVIACEHTYAKKLSLGAAWDRAREAMYRRARAVVAPHAATAEWLGRRGAPAVAIPNPLVTPPATTIERRERKRLVSLGRLSPEKRTEVLIRAFAMIAPAHPQWDLEIWGDGPLRASLERQAHERVHFRGFADAYDILRGADLFASASWIEGYGNAIWEALACGVPVVAMDAGAPMRSLVRDGIDGVIVRTDTIAALAAALGSLMGDDEKRAGMARRAGEIVQRFSMDASLARWDEVLGGV